MKRLCAFVTAVVIFMTCFSGCVSSNDIKKAYETGGEIIGTVSNVSPLTVIVPESYEFYDADGIRLNITGKLLDCRENENGKKFSEKKLKVGDTLQILFDGNVIEKTPPVINALQVKIIG